MSGGSDPDANPRLRLAIQKANAVNMPKDTIERTVKKAAGELEGVTYEEIRYEGYAQNGVAVMVDTLTDNRNRTVAEVRHAFSKAGGNLGTDGSVAYLFDKIGVLNFAPGTSEDEVMEVALEAGADDIVTEEDGSIEVVTSPEALCRRGQRHGGSRPHAGQRGGHHEGQHGSGTGRGDRAESPEVPGRAGRPRRRTSRVFQRRYP